MLCHDFMCYVFQIRVTKTPKKILPGQEGNAHKIQQYQQVYVNADINRLKYTTTYQRKQSLGKKPAKTFLGYRIQTPCFHTRRGIGTADRAVLFFYAQRIAAIYAVLICKARGLAYR